MEIQPILERNKIISKQRINYLWKRVRQIARTIGRINKMSKQIQLYGASKYVYEKKRGKDNSMGGIYKGSSKWVFGQKNTFKKYWSIIILLLMLYTATVTPYLVCFVQDETQSQVIFGYLVDGLFMLDIFVNFNSAFKNLEGKWVFNRCLIAKQYLKTWFFLDLVACLPFQLISQNQQNSEQGEYNKLLRLLRLSRFYRLIRVLRLLKMIRLFKSSSFFKRIISVIKANNGIIRLIKFSFTVVILVHIVGCFWYFVAKLDDQHPDSWVSRYGYIDSDNFTLYITSVYWVFTTLTTVGYGDIVPHRVLERFFTLILMAFGVAFYSYTISNLSAMMANLDTRTANLKRKLSALNEFAKTTKLPQSLKKQIKFHIQLNHRQNIFSWFDQDQLMNELPQSVRTEISLHMHHKVVEKIYFLQDKNPDFISYVIPKLRTIFMQPGEFLYKEHQYPDQMYFLIKGRVNLLASNGVMFKSYIQGSYFGEVDILDNRRRDCTVQISKQDAQIMVLSRKHLLAMIQEFPKIKDEIFETARLRLIKNNQAKTHASNLIPKKPFEKIKRNQRRLSISQKHSKKNLSQLDFKPKKPKVFEPKKQKNRKMWKKLFELDKDDKEIQSKWDTILRTILKKQPTANKTFKMEPTFSLATGPKAGLVQKAISRHPAEKSKSKWQIVRKKKDEILQMQDTAAFSKMDWFADQANIDSPLNTEGEENATDSQLAFLRTLKSYLIHHNTRLGIKVNVQKRAVESLQESERILQKQIRILRESI